MKVYLVRHGEYQTIDGRKVLSENGEKATEKIAKIAKEQFMTECYKIFHSTKIRAKQTSEIIDRIVNSEKGIVEKEGLEPDANPTPWRDFINNQKKPVMFVTHLPFLRKLLSLLIASDVDADILTFYTSSIVCLEKTEDGTWLIDWSIH